MISVRLNRGRHIVGATTPACLLASSSLSSTGRHPRPPPRLNAAVPTPSPVLPRRTTPTSFPRRRPERRLDHATPLDRPCLPPSTACLVSDAVVSVLLPERPPRASTPPCSPPLVRTRSSSPVPRSSSRSPRPPRPPPRPRTVLIPLFPAAPARCRPRPPLGRLAGAARSPADLAVAAAPPAVAVASPLAGAPCNPGQAPTRPHPAPAPLRPLCQCQTGPTPLKRY